MVIKVGDKTNLSTQFAIMTILLTALIIVFVASYTIITTQKSRYHCSHFMDEEAETCEAQEACPVSQTVFEAELTFATST